MFNAVYNVLQCWDCRVMGGGNSNDHYLPTVKVFQPAIGLAGGGAGSTDLMQLKF